MKSLCFKQVYWAKKLSQYYFLIDYYRGKRNAAVNILSWCFQKSNNKKHEL